MLKMATDRVRSHERRNPIASRPAIAAAKNPATMATHSTPVWASVRSLRDP